MLEAILPALASVLLAPPPAPGGEAAVTASLAAAIAAANRPASQKVVTVEEKCPHSYSRLLLLVGVPGADSLHDFWHDYADQKKARHGHTCSPPRPQWPRVWDWSLPLLTPRR
jgi:hypothetical protein